ncbi:MAG: hypothetical protein DSM106950_42150, partial [Stigonema ocellatum SAG 48.90 = DSM 106950]|nr:hypothetical protein [Stigonema ocellatum SAG 48.90 = DSM 106950]
MSEESLTDKFKRLFNTTQSGIDKIKTAWEEKNITFYEWECINEGVLDFDLIEKDIIKISKEIKQNNVVILGTQFTINKLNKFIEINTYIKEGDKFFKDQKIGEFKSLSNLPSDVKTELEKEGSVTIQPNLEKEGSVTIQPNLEKEGSVTIQPNLEKEGSVTIQPNLEKEGSVTIQP